MIYLEPKRIELYAEIPQEARDWRNHPSIQRWCRQQTDISHSSHTLWLDRIERDASIKMFGIKQRELNQWIGVCGLTSLDQVNQKAEFSLYIAPNHQCIGLGLHALQTLVYHGFKNLNLNRIWGEVFDGNPAASLFKKMGFIHEGTQRQAYFRDGKFIDSHIISLLRGDFCLS